MQTIPTFIYSMINCKCLLPSGDTGESVSPPKIASSPTSLTVHEYNSASFRCKAEGLPIPVITWYRNGSSLIVRDRHTAQPNNTLLLRNVTFSDHGTYTFSLISMPSRFAFFSTQTSRSTFTTVTLTTLISFIAKSSYWSTFSCVSPLGPCKQRFSSRAQNVLIMAESTCLI